MEVKTVSYKELENRYGESCCRVMLLKRQLKDIATKDPEYNQYLPTEDIISTDEIVETVSIEELKSQYEESCAREIKFTSQLQEIAASNNELSIFIADILGQVEQQKRISEWFHAGKLKVINNGNNTIKIVGLNELYNIPKEPCETISRLPKKQQQLDTPIIKPKSAYCCIC